MADIAQIAIEVRVTGAEKAKGDFNSLGASTQGLQSNLSGVAQKILAIVSAYEAWQVASGFIKRGFDFNAQMEGSRIGIASIVASTNTLRDAQGRVLQGQAAFSASLQIAEKLMRDIQVAGLETTATTEEMVRGFQAMVGPASAAGLSLEQIQKSTVLMTQAMGALNIPLREMAVEARSIFEGSINPTQDRLAIALQITNEDVRKWKQAGTLFQELQKRMEMYAHAGVLVADSWAGLSSNMQDALSWLSGTTGRGFFEGVKSGYRDVLKAIVDIKNAKAGPAVDNIADAVQRLQHYMGESFAAAARGFVAWLEKLNQPENLSILESRIKAVYESLTAAAGLTASVATGFGQLFGSALDGWNSMPELIRSVGIVGAMFFGLKGLAVMTTVGFALDQVKRLKEGAQDYAGMNQDEVSSMLESMGLGSLPPQKIVMASTRNGVTTGESAYNYNETAWRNKGTGVTATGKPKGPNVDAMKKATSVAKSLREELARLTQIEGQQKAALMEEKYQEFAKTLGAAHPLVRQFAAELERVRTTGHTTAESLKATQAVMEDVARQERELTDKSTATRPDGSLDSGLLEQIRARTKAEEDYAKAVKDGADESVAARRRDNEMQLAGCRATQDNAQVQQQFYSAAAQLLKGREDLVLQAIEREVETYRRAGVDVTLLEEYAARMRLNASRKASDGMIRAMLDYHDEATNLAKGVEGVMTNAFTSMEDVFVKFVQTGKLSFADLVNSMLADMARLAARQAMGGIVGGIGNIIGNALGGWLGGGSSVSTGIGGAGWQGSTGSMGNWNSGMSLGVSSFHTGGLVGVDGAHDRAMPVSVFEHAPRFHDGGGYFRQDEYPAVLQYGERVLNRRDTAAFDAAMRMPRAPMPVMQQRAAAAPTIIIHNYAKGAEAKAEAQQQPDGSFKIDVIVEEVDRRMAQRVTSGKSHTARALDATRGMSPAPAAYRG